jgi:transmembrane sensor
MAVEKDLYEKIAAYLSGNISPGDKIDLDNWRNSSGENERLFQEASAIWKHANIRLEYDGDANEDWIGLQSLLDKHVTVSFWSKTWFKVAAVMLLLISAIWIVNLDKSKSKQITEKLVYQSGTAVKTIILPDSSTVWLNSNSTMEYSIDMANKTRTVNLIGEAYFKVKRSDSLSFTALTENSRTHVVGTSFNLKQYDHKTSLAVAEGVVEFSSRDTVQVIIVRKKEAASVSNSEKPLKTKYLPEVGNWRTKNNSAFSHEKESPKAFMHTDFKWRKNALNLSVIEGHIKSNSTLAGYKNITLRISYRKKSGKVISTPFTIAGPLAASGKIYFEKRLMDLFSDTRDVKVEIESAEVF